MKSLIKMTLAVAVLLSAPVTAFSATCDLNINRVYETSIKHGWVFRCTKGVLHFNNFKQPGCAIKPILPSAWEEARFLSNSGFPDQANAGVLKNNWKIKSFVISGGQWSEKTTGRGSAPARVHFTFSAPMGKFTRRYLSKLVVEKNGGNCNNAYDEAF